MAAKKKKTTVVTVRLSEQMLKTIDEDIVPKVAAEHWEDATTSRGAAIRYLIKVGIESVKAKDT